MHMITLKVGRQHHVHSSFFQMLSRAKPAVSTGTNASSTANDKKKKVPRLEDFIANRDFTGASTLLEVVLSRGNW